jgi:hypothetical protein
MFATIPELGRSATTYSYQINPEESQRIKITSDKVRNRSFLIIRNWGKSTVYIGRENVNKANGFPLLPREVIVLALQGDWYAFCDKKAEIRTIEG